MPSSASRSRGTTRRSPRSAPRAVDLPLAERPLAVPFAAFFGLLVAAEDVYLAWLLWTPEVGWDWFMAVPLLLAVPGLAVLAVIFAVLGGGQEVWSTLLLLVGPAGCLVLATRRPVREWTRARRSPGGRRIPTRSR
jgi:hypothetical protein